MRKGDQEEARLGLQRCLDALDQMKVPQQHFLIGLLSLTSRHIYRLYGQVRNERGSFLMVRKLTFQDLRRPDRLLRIFKASHNKLIRPLFLYDLHHRSHLFRHRLLPQPPRRIPTRNSPSTQRFLIPRGLSLRSLQQWVAPRPDQRQLCHTSQDMTTGRQRASSSTPRF